MTSESGQNSKINNEGNVSLQTKLNANRTSDLIISLVNSPEETTIWLEKKLTSLGFTCVTTNQRTPSITFIFVTAKDSVFRDFTNKDAKDDVIIPRDSGERQEFLNGILMNEAVVGATHIPGLLESVKPSEKLADVFKSLNLQVIALHDWQALNSILSSSLLHFPDLEAIRDYFGTSTALHIGYSAVYNLFLVFSILLTIAASYFLSGATTDIFTFAILLFGMVEAWNMIEIKLQRKWNPNFSISYVPTFKAILCSALCTMSGAAYVSSQNRSLIFIDRIFDHECGDMNVIKNACDILIPCFLFAFWHRFTSYILRIITKNNRVQDKVSVFRLLPFWATICSIVAVITYENSNLSDLPFSLIVILVTTTNLEMLLLDHNMRNLSLKWIRNIFSRTLGIQTVSPAPEVAEIIYQAQRSQPPETMDLSSQLMANVFIFALLAARQSWVYFVAGLAVSLIVVHLFKLLLTSTSIRPIRDASTPDRGGHILRSNGWILSILALVFHEAFEPDAFTPNNERTKLLYLVSLIMFVVHLFMVLLNKIMNEAYQACSH